MKKAKLIFAILMSMAMVVTMTPVFAFAADEVADDQVTAVEEQVVENDATVEDVQAAVAEVAPEDAALEENDGSQKLDNIIDMQIDKKTLYVGETATVYLSEEDRDYYKHAGSNIGIKSEIDAINAVAASNDYFIKTAGEPFKYAQSGEEPYWVYPVLLTAVKAGSISIGVYLPGDETYNETYKLVNMTIKGQAGGDITSVKLKTKTYTYDGKAKCPAVVVKAGSTVLKKNRDYKVTYKNNKMAGTAYCTVTGKGSYTGTLVTPYTIKKGKQTIKVGTSTKIAKGGSAYIEQKGFTATQNVGVFSYKSSNTNVVTVTRDSKHNCIVKGVGTGTAYVTITAAATRNLNKATLKLKYTVTSSSPTGKIKLTKSNVTLDKTTLKVGQYPKITVKYNGKTLKAGKNGDYWFYISGEHKPGKGQCHVWGTGKYTGDVYIDLTYVK